MSTNTNNYSIGIARLYWRTVTSWSSAATEVDTVATAVKTASGYDAYDLGNVVGAEITPDITYLDHYISYAGARRKDKTVAITKSLNIPITLDEVNSTNLKNFFGAKNDVSGNIMRVFENDQMPVEGAAVLAFYTDIGTDFMYVIPKAALRTEGAAFSFNTEDWMNIPMTIEVLQNSSYKPPNAAAASLAPYGYIDYTATGGAAPGV